MSEPYRKTHRPWEPQRYRHAAHSPHATLSEGDRVFFVLDTVPKLDLSRFYTPYEGESRGAPPFAPAMMVCLGLYVYCVGVFSSRKIAQAGALNLAFIALVGTEFKGSHMRVSSNKILQKYDYHTPYIHADRRLLHVGG